MSANAPGQLSPDGSYYWNGQQWVSTLSPDGAHRWNGTAWVATASQPAPVGAPTYGVAPARRGGLGFQFGGAAAWSIGFGVASILVPLVTATLSSSVYYFYVLPLFGIYRGFIAIRFGRTMGGAIGILLNIVGGIISLLASGVIH